MLPNYRLKNYLPNWEVKDLNGRVVERFIHHRTALKFKKEHELDYFELTIDKIK